MRNFILGFLSCLILYLIASFYIKRGNEIIAGDRYDSGGNISFAAYQHGKLIGFVPSVQHAVIRSLTFDSLVIQAK